MGNRTLSVAQVCFLMGFGLAACVGEDPAPGGDTAADGGNASSSGGSSSGGASSSGGGSSSGSSGDPDAGTLAPDAAPPAGCPLGCLPPTPGGWTGPSALFDDTSAKKPTDCPELYTQRLVDAHQGLKAAAAVCLCGAATNSGAKCTADVLQYTNTTCTSVKGQVTATSVDSNSCSVAMGTNVRAKVTGAVITRGVCSYPNATTTLPKETYDKENIACGLPTTAASCENRADCIAAPLPKAPFTRLCIHKDGDELCPSADYSVRILAHKKFDDTRACTKTCAGTPGGGACGTKWGFTLAGSKTCQPAFDVSPPTTFSVDDCVTVASTTDGANLHALAPTGVSCAITAGTTPNGDVKSTEPVTFCCNN